MRKLSRIALVLLGACDIPTELPKWNTTFIVQAENTTLSVGQLLPSTVTPNATNTAFTLSLAPATFSQTLGQLCTACAAFNGTTAPKPAFIGTFTTAIALPAEVRSAQLTGGTLNLSIQNGFTFDPLRPAAASRGEITITITSNGVTIGSQTISGTATALPAGGTLNAAIPLTAGTIANTVDVSVTVDSPAGDPAPMNANDRISATASPSGLTISSAQVTVNSRQVNAAAVTLDLANVDNFIIDHVQGGSLLLTISNPFGVTGPLTLTFAGGAQTITKSVNLGPGTSNLEVVFTAAELRALLGHSVTMTVTGRVSAAGSVNVTPAQILTVDARLKLLLGPGN